MPFCVEACVDASMEDNGASAGIAGEVVYGHDRASVISVYQYQCHMAVGNIHEAEWAAVLIAACYMNSCEMNWLIRRNANGSSVRASIHTDRSCNLRRLSSCMAFYSWNCRRMYRVELDVRHMHRTEDWMVQQNARARAARELPLGTAVANGYPWMQSVRPITWEHVCSPISVVVPSNQWMPRI